MGEVKKNEKSILLEESGVLFFRREQLMSELQRINARLTETGNLIVGLENASKTKEPIVAKKKEQKV